MINGEAAETTAIDTTVNSTETGLGIVLPEDYFERCQWLPVQEANFYDDVSAQINAQTDEERGGEHYAWLRLPRWLHHRRAAIKETTGSINIVDVGSGFPIYAEVMRSLHFSRCGTYGTKIVKEYLEAGLAEQPPIEPRTLNAIRKILQDKKSPIRQLLTSHVRKVLYVLSEDDISGSREEIQSAIQNMLLYEICSGTDLFTTIEDSEHYEGRNKIATTRSSMDKTVLEMLAEMRIPTPAAHAAGQIVAEDANQFKNPDVANMLKERAQLDIETANVLSVHAAKYISQAVIAGGLARPFKTISIDYATPDTLLADSLLAFDKPTRVTGIYQRAQERLKSGQDHWEMDMFSDEIDIIPDESLALLTIFDSFPIYFGIPPESEAEEIAIYRAVTQNFAQRIYKKLQPSGRIIIFPWDIANKTAADRELLDDMRRVWLRCGAEVNRKSYSKEQLYSWMTPEERSHLAEHSSIFKTGYDLFDLMVVQRPPKGQIVISGD